MSKSRPSFGPFSLLAEAWTFFRKQPVLLHVLLWLLILPTVAFHLMDVYWPQSEAESIQQIGQLSYGLAQFIVGFLAFWGFCCVLLVGRRMVKSMAGRSRTSFTSVRRESIRIILPLFFTSLLRSFFIFYWSLLFLIPAGLYIFFSPACHVPVIAGVPAFLRAVQMDNEWVMARIVRHVVVPCSPVLLFLPLFIPAILYSIRTIFYPIIVAAEGLRFREALRKSKSVMRGRTWRVIFTTIGLGILVGIPAFVLSIAFEMLQNTAAPDLPLLSIIASDIFFGFSAFLLTLSLVAFYARLKKEKGRVQQVVPEDM